MSEGNNIDKLNEKLNRALRAKAVLTERSKLLAQQVEDFRKREEQAEHIVVELLDRQRELNFMLHRANSVLHRIQEANAVLSTEFTELVKELPAPSSPDWEERVNKINELFKKTGALADEIQDDIFGKGTDTLMEKATPAAKPQAQESMDSAIDTKPKTEPAPAQEPNLEQDAEHEESIQASTLSANSDSEPDAVEEELEDLVVVEAQFSDPDPVNPNVQKRLDRLFGQAGAKPKKQQESKPKTNAAETETKQGLLSGIWRKMSTRKRKNSKNELEAELTADESPLADTLVESAEPEIADIAEPEQKLEDIVQPESVEAKLYNDSQHEQPVDQGLSNLLNNTADELEKIQMEFIPVEADGLRSGSTLIDEGSKKPISFWARWMARLEAERHRRALLAINRVAEKRSRRKNRRRDQMQALRTD